MTNVRDAHKDHENQAFTMIYVFASHKTEIEEEQIYVVTYQELKKKKEKKKNRMLASLD
jgi:hypothetical protein